MNYCRWIFFGGRGFPDPKPSFGVTSDKGRYSLASIMRNMAKCFEAPNWRQQKKNSKGVLSHPYVKMRFLTPSKLYNFPTYSVGVFLGKMHVSNRFSGTHDAPSRSGLLVWFCDTGHGSGNPAPSRWYCWWRKSEILHQLRLVVYPIILRVLYMPRWCRIPSTVWRHPAHVSWKVLDMTGGWQDFSHQQQYKLRSVYPRAHFYWYFWISAMIQTHLFQKVKHPHNPALT